MSTWTQENYTFLDVGLALSRWTHKRKTPVAINIDTVYVVFIGSEF